MPSRLTPLSGVLALALLGGCAQSQGTLHEDHRSPRPASEAAGHGTAGHGTAGHGTAAGHGAGHGTSPSAAADPRVGLRAGMTDAGEAALGLRLIANTPRPPGMGGEETRPGFAFANTDLAFMDGHVVVGNYAGFNIYDVSDPARPRLVTSVVCPGGQGDVSVYGNLLFMSVEEARGRLDCGVQGVPTPVSQERFRGVRIFDLSDLSAPRQVGAVQTCRGSHTHTVVPYNDEKLYVYVSGSSYVRPGEELPGCVPAGPDEDPETSLFRIEVIEVPLAAPQQARVVNEVRLFADEATGRVDGLWRGGTHGEGTQRTAVTNHCHDITVYPALGLAAGACSGNGLLIDISDPARPVRIHEVSDPNFAYWHSATFNNDGTTVIFTDEWGGGTAPRCRETDPINWGANALFRVEDRRLVHAGYYKMPAPQTATENCVAHNGSLVPVPGRDIKVQAWYQGGISMFDFTDPSAPFEIAYFDRGPLSETELFVGGYWSAYWHEGKIYGAEITRGLDVFDLEPTEHLTQHEIDAARLARGNMRNAQTQKMIEWPAAPAVAHAYLDQLARSGAMPAAEIAQVRALVAPGAPAGARQAAAQRLAAAAAPLGDTPDARRMTALAETLTALR
ncbi:MAG: LVIVD repeat-containing protein [Rubricoccaceae bacterium]